jgi:hypothetical protein
MKLEFEVYECLCAPVWFSINDINADENDFGSKDDEAPEAAEQYGCGNMRFTRKESSLEILNKYSINQNEYDMICEKLEEGLSFGYCGWCI